MDLMARRRAEKRTAERILEILRTREIGKTMCPSEILAPAQRKVKSKMEEVRRIAGKMAADGKIEITQRGKVRNAGPWKGPIRLRLRKTMVPFETGDVDFRAEPERYRVARGEQGVLSVEPYKSELLPHWKFRTEAIAKVSAAELWKHFGIYRRRGDFVGMDMARKFIQMGFTRARRYANHRSGKKYIGAVPRAMKGRSGAHGRAVAPLEPDAEKARIAKIFGEVLLRVEANRDYIRQRKAWQNRYG